MTFTTRPEILGTFGVVTSTHWLASAAGMAILEKGGNAFDAAVATGLALQVVEPHLNGLGGEVPILLYDRQADDVRVLCGQGTAPAGATIDHYRSEGLSIVPGTGLLAAVVPGAFDAWMCLLRDYGTMRLAEVLAPAIGYAGDGYPLLPRVAQTIDEMKDFFIGHWPTSAATYLSGGEAPAARSLFRNPVLAQTYQRIVREAESVSPDRDRQIAAAQDQFYRGFVAESIDAFGRGEAVMDCSGARHRGVLSGDDMAGWGATYEAPLAYDYHNHTVYKTGPWGQGPVFLQQLALLSGFDIDSMDPTGPDFVHTVAECAKLAFADREAYYGDPNFSDVPIETLLSTAYNTERRKLVATEASRVLRPGQPDGLTPRFGGPLAPVPAARPGSGGGEPTFSPIQTGDTCHLDVIDRHGNMVAATPSGGWLQSSPVIPELGFCLSTRAQMFWLEPDLPTSLGPGRRPRTTLTPSMARRDGKPYLAFGTPGGDQQDQWTLIMFLRHVHQGMNLQAAIDAPLFHTEHFRSSFYPRDEKLGLLHIEESFPAETLEALRARGHAVNPAAPWSIGRVCAAAQDGTLLRAAATPRLMQAYAVGR